MYKDLQVLDTHKAFPINDSFSEEPLRIASLVNVARPSHNSSFSSLVFWGMELVLRDSPALSCWVGCQQVEWRKEREKVGGMSVFVPRPFLSTHLCFLLLNVLTETALKSHVRATQQSTTF